VQTQYDAQNIGITLVIKNLSPKPTKVFVLDVYSGQKVNFAIDAGKTVLDARSLSRFFGWYDFVITVDADASIEYHVAGHVENGKGSISDPALGPF
jgi:phospholipase C